jgi:hypothetical protein
VIHQLEVDNSTLNEFRIINPSDSFTRYLPGVLITPYRIIILCLKNLNSLSPVYRFFSSLNLIFILIILTLTWVSARSWIYPDYPNRVNGENQVNSNRKITHLTINRENLGSKRVAEVVSNNLFRKERSEYQPPVQPKPITQMTEGVSSLVLPPPNLTLRGVMLLSDTRIAILEGTYPIGKGDKFESIPIKRKGYYLGDQIGSYKIAQITKREVTLSNTTGQIFTVKIKKNILSANKTPKRKKRKPKFTSTQPVTKKRPQQTPRISGARMSPLPKHISGR